MAENVIFYFSGTGNCLDIARNIAKGIGGADLVRIKKGMTTTDVTEAKKVGFVFPCYGGGAPEDVLKYAKQIKVSPSAYTFGVTSCAAYKGTGLSRLNKIIPLKYWGVITHHCSCIWLFPHNLMMPRLSVGEAEARSKDLARIIANDVMAGKTKRRPGLNIFNAIENAGFSKILQKKSKAGKTFYACEKGKECGFMSWYEPTDKICPKCGSSLFRRRGKSPALLCQKEGCGYIEAVTK